MKLGQYKRHPVIPNPPFFLHFTILIKDMCIGFTRKKIIPRSHDGLRRPGSKLHGLPPRNVLELTPKAWKVSQGTKNHGNFFGKILCIKNYLINLCVIPQKNIYIYMIYVAPTVLICVIFSCVIFFGGGSIDSQKRTSPRFSFGFLVPPGAPEQPASDSSPHPKAMRQANLGGFEGVVYNTSSQGMINMSHLSISIESMGMAYFPTFD